MKIVIAILAFAAIFFAMALIAVEFVAMDEAGLFDAYFGKRVERWKKRAEKESADD